MTGSIVRNPPPAATTCNGVPNCKIMVDDLNLSSMVKSVSLGLTQPDYGITMGGWLELTFHPHIAIKEIEHVLMPRLGSDVNFEIKNNPHFTSQPPLLHATPTGVTGKIIVTSYPVSDGDTHMTVADHPDPTVIFPLTRTPAKTAT